MAAAERLEYMEEIRAEVNRRRTFAIISHPDAGKTTMTEKLLLYGGAIRLAGSVKARKASKHAGSNTIIIASTFWIRRAIRTFPRTRTGR